MAYQKQTWTDRNVETPRTYTMVENQDGTVTLIPAPGTVTAEGTPVSAARMNHIEDGIDGAVCKAGDTMTGALTINANITQPTGHISGDGTIDHAIKLGHNGDNVMEFNEYGGLYNFYRNASNPRELIFQISGSQGISAAPLPVGSGGTGANGVEESQISINPDLAALGINVGLRDNNTTVAKIRRWGKLYTMQYEAVLSQSTYTGATNWHPLIVDNKGWLSSQAANMPYFAWANSDYQLLQGINLWCENGRTYGLSFMSMNLTWIDPN